MFIRNSNKYNNLIDKSSEQDLKQEKLKCRNFQLEKILDSIQENLNNNNLLLDIYSIENDLYEIFLEIRRSYNIKCEMTTYKINQGVSLTEKICASSVVFYKNIDNDNPTNISMELVNIDTLSSFETRRGHASKHIEIYKKICNVFEVKRIYGKLYLFSSMGIDSLKKFYEKNGFNVTDSMFYMDLKH